MLVNLSHACLVGHTRAPQLVAVREMRHGVCRRHGLNHNLDHPADRLRSIRRQRHRILSQGVVNADPGLYAASRRAADTGRLRST